MCLLYDFDGMGSFPWALLCDGGWRSEDCTYFRLDACIEAE